ncbi:MAG TPA: HlyD family secretion protein [Bacteroidia bacterium]|nr:HlyD family secretion protein [Bacteroidia bacterium]
MSTEEKEPKKKKAPTTIILGLILLAGIIIGVYEYLKYKNVVSTDDAQLSSNIDPVVARISDYVTSINFKDNEHVTKGQVLVQLDDKDLVIKEQQAEANLNDAQANADVSKASAASVQSLLATSKDEITSAKINYDKARRDFERYQNLYKDGSVTQEQFDQYRTTMESDSNMVDIANKKYASAQKQYDLSLANLTSAQAAVAVKQSDLNFTKLQLSYATITAPASGIASKRSIQLGQLVGAGSSLLAVVEDSVWVEANFKETQLSDIKPGQTANVTIDALNGQIINGTVSSFAGATGALFSLLPPDNATGNFVKVVQRIPIKVVLDTKNPDYKKLRPGLSVEVSITVQ